MMNRFNEELYGVREGPISKRCSRAPLIPSVTHPEALYFPEGLSSYLTRAAANLSLTKTELIENYVLPRVSLSYSRRFLDSGRDAYSINSTGKVSIEFDNACRQLFSQFSHHEFSSFGFLEPLLGAKAKSVVSRYLKWCPYCLQGWRRNHLVRTIDSLGNFRHFISSLMSKYGCSSNIEKKLALSDSLIVRWRVRNRPKIAQLLEYAAMILENSEQRLVKIYLLASPSLLLSMNGASVQTNSLRDALSHLQPTTNFSQLTLKAYEHSTNGLMLQAKLKKQIHWCVHCFEEWQQNDIETHYPLIWLLQGHHSCVKHRMPLSNICMSCGSEYKQLNHSLMNSTCSRCKGALILSHNQCVSGQQEMF